jgi:HK97 family phage portal protein
MPNPPGGWIEFPGTFKDPEAKRVFRESYQAAQSGSNRGKVLVLENGMKFHEVGVTNKDAQFLELRKFQITDIARMFRVPPHMIADLDRRSVLQHRAAKPGVRHAHHDALGGALGGIHRS